MAYAYIQQAENSVSAGVTGLQAILGGPAAAIASASQTVATPGVFTTATNAFTANTPVYLTGTAPGGFSLNTLYWVIAAGLTTTTCQLSLTSGGAGIQCTASAACTINPTISTTIHNAVAVVSSQHPASIATISDTLAETWLTVPGGGIFGNGLFAYVCLDSKGGPNIIQTNSNSTNLTANYVAEFSGLKTTGGVLSSAVLGQNGPGAGANTLTAGNIAATFLPAMHFGFCMDCQGAGNMPTAGTVPASTGRGSVWGGNTGGVHALAEDRRVTAGATSQATFGNAAGSNIYVSIEFLLAEIGAIANGGGTGTGSGPPGGKWSWMKRR